MTGTGQETVGGSRQSSVLYRKIQFEYHQRYLHHFEHDASVFIVSSPSGSWSLTRVDCGLTTHSEATKTQLSVGQTQARTVIPVRHETTPRQEHNAGACVALYCGHMGPWERRIKGPRAPAPATAWSWSWSWSRHWPQCVLKDVRHLYSRSTLTLHITNT